VPPSADDAGSEKRAARQATDARQAATGKAGGSGSPRKPAPRKPAARKAPARRTPAKTAAAASAPTTSRLKAVPELIIETTDAASLTINASLHAPVADAITTPEPRLAPEPLVAPQAEPESTSGSGSAGFDREPEAPEVEPEQVPAKPAKKRVPRRTKAAQAEKEAEAAALIEARAQAEATAQADAAAQARAEVAAQADAAAQADVAAQADAAAQAAAAAQAGPQPVAPVDKLFVRPLVEHAAPREAVGTRPHPLAPSDSAEVVLSIQRLRKTYGATVAVDAVSLNVRAGSLYGIVGPNGAGKTTTLSIATGLLRPDAGTVWVHGLDVWRSPSKAKRSIGVLPDRLRLFDRLTGAQFLHYAGTLRGLDVHTVRERANDLAVALGLEDALGRLVADYSAGMTKKVALAAAMIHSPRLLVLDEPFESVDPVSAANVIDILQKYVAAGGTVVLSSHGMDLIQRICDSVAIIVNGKVLDSGTVDQVRAGGSLEDRFVELAGGRKAAEGLEWLHSFSD
jgi:ABC-type multidrug transport system ATPase subunit